MTSAFSSFQTKNLQRLYALSPQPWSAKNLTKSFLGFLDNPISSSIWAFVIPLHFFRLAISDSCLNQSCFTNLLWMALSYQTCWTAKAFCQARELFCCQSRQLECQSQLTFSPTALRPFEFTFLRKLSILSMYFFQQSSLTRLCSFSDLLFSQFSSSVLFARDELREPISARLLISYRLSQIICSLRNSFSFWMPASFLLYSFWHSEISSLTLQF